MFPDVNEDILGLILAHLPCPINALRLISTCHSGRTRPDAREIAFGYAMKMLTEMQSIQTRASIVPIDWVTLLQMGNMTVFQLWHLSARNMYCPSMKGYKSMIMFFLNARHTDEECLRHLVQYLRKNPTAFLYSDWWGSDGGPSSLMGLTLAPPSRRLNGVEVEIDVTMLNVPTVGMPPHKHVRYVCQGGPQDWINHPQPRFCTYNDRSHDGFSSMEYLDAGDTSHVCLNLAFLYDQLMRRRTITSPPRTQRTDMSNFKPDSSTSSSCPPFSLQHANCILQAAFSVRDAACIHFIALSAIQTDDVTKMTIALQAYGNRRFGDLELEDDMWCLHFRPGCNFPLPPFYIARHDSDSHRFPLHRLIHDQLNLSSHMVHWGGSLLGIDDQFSPNHSLVSMTFFLLYTQTLCPNIYAWWMGVCPLYSQEELKMMRRTLVVNGLPPIERVPVSSGEGRRFVRLDLQS